jgi:hypothetical protein
MGWYALRIVKPKVVVTSTSRVCTQAIHFIDDFEKVSIHLFEAGLRIGIYALIFALDVLGLIKVYELLRK